MGEVILARLELTFTPKELELLRRGLTVASDDGAYTDAESEIVAELDQRLSPRRVRV